MVEQAAVTEQEMVRESEQDLDLEQVAETVIRYLVEKQHHAQHQPQPHHTMNVQPNYRQIQHPRMRRSAIDYRPSASTNKNRKSSTGRRYSSTDSGQNLYSVASRKIEKRYGILGSGNFEIIRGGILPEEPAKDKPTPKSKSSPENDNSVVDNSSAEKGDSEENGDDAASVTGNGHGSSSTESDSDGDNNHNTPTDEQNSADPPETGSPDEDDGNANNNPLDDTFEPLNLDIFGNQDPFNGLQSKRNNNIL